MKEIKMTIPEGCKTVTIKVDGGQVTTEFEPKETKFEPKDGDIIACDETDDIFHRIIIIIFKNTIIGKFTNVYAGFRPYDGFIELSDSNWGRIGCYRPATDEEKQLLFDALAKEGKRWNADKKQLENLPRWRADYRRKYFFVTNNLSICSTFDTEGSIDILHYKQGNYFKTAEAAERAAKQVREVFSNSKAE